MLTNWLIFAGLGLVALGLLWVLGRWALRRLWRASLMRQFGDEAMVDVIMEGTIARGMTREMVEAALGTPADVDEVVLKTKAKLEMKYDPKGRNRFGTRVRLEDGYVVGWEIK